MSEKQSSPSSQVQKSEPKKEENKPAKIFTPDEVKKIALDSALGQFGMNEKIRKLGEETLPTHIAGKCSNEIVNEEMNDISKALSLDSGHILMESMLESYRGLAFQMKLDLHREFDCKTASEKAMVDLAVNSYIRLIFLTKKLTFNQNFENYYHEINGYFNVISKDIDRAHRQFISTIESLKLMKQPALKVNVKTNTAFISENQQFNNNVETNEAK
jgi:hypothetical protein